MSGSSFLSRLRFWEPEETVGHAWDDYLHRAADTPSHPDAAVALSDMSGALGVFFRGLGGNHGVAIKAGAATQSHHRRRFRRRLARASESVSTARYDGLELLLPETLDVFSERATNRRLYLWLAALAVFSSDTEAAPVDPLQADVARLARSAYDARGALAALPGLKPLRDELYARARAARPCLALPPIEERIERWICEELDGARRTASDDVLDRALMGDAEARGTLVAPKGYKPFRPVSVWLDRGAPPIASPRRNADESPTPGSGAADGDKKKRAAKRRKSDQADRRDSLILHRFESILAMADFLNLNRAVDDDDEAGARKAADDAEKMAVGEHRKSPKTRLKFDLDLAPEDADRETTDGRFVYPEWNFKTRSLDPQRTRILEALAKPAETIVPRGPAARRRIEKVRRRFEALRPRRRMLSRQSEGSELDLDEVVRALADRRAGGPVTDRLYRDARNEERDLAVAVLLDVSRSTESAVHGRPVISVAREALEALARGLDACGDQVALYAFSSVRRDRVFVDVCKTFDEPFGAQVDARIAGLKPGFYTRLGAAIRHVSFRLSERPNARKLLLVITDGKPNDIDHYEGRFGIEDTRMAVQEARRLGQAVFAITVDEQARAYLPYLFGRSGYAMAPASDRLIDALPAIYRHIVA